METEETIKVGKQDGLLQEGSVGRYGCRLFTAQSLKRADEAPLPHTHSPPCPKKTNEILHDNNADTWPEYKQNYTACSNVYIHTAYECTAGRVGALLSSNIDRKHITRSRHRCKLKLALGREHTGGLLVLD